MRQTVKFHKAEKYAVKKSAITADVRTFFLQNFGCARKVYNLYVDHLYSCLEKIGYANGDIKIANFPIPEITEFKKDYAFLKSADSLALANAKIAFQSACKRYDESCDHVSYTKRALRRAKEGTEALSFRGLKGMPKFHAKAHGDFSYTTNCQYPGKSNSLKQPTIRLCGDRLYLPKLKDGVELVIHRPLPENAVIGNVTVSMDTDGSIYASVEYSYEKEIDVSIREAVLAGDCSIVKDLKFVGFDYSQNDFYVSSDGRKANYPHYYRMSEEKLSKQQRRLSRMEKGSSNYNKQLLKVQKISKKIRNQRYDFVSKEAYLAAKEFDVCVVEDIDLRAMGQCLNLGKSLHDNGFGMFRTKLANKLAQKGSVLVKVDKWFPSSQLCSTDGCDYRNPDVKDMAVREWVCPKCGTKHDRDVNAAINIREEGKRIFMEYAANEITKQDKSKKRAETRSQNRKNKKQKSSKTSEPGGTPEIDCFTSSGN